jgi:redox-sensitive bicupin YhaK (pirin superfamily)
LVASRDGREGSVTVHQDVNLYATLLETDARLHYVVPATRRAWLQVAKGSVELNDEPLAAGDAAAVSDAGPLELVGKQPAELLLFDLR